MPVNMKKGSTYLEEQIRKAIKKSGLTTYKLWKQTGVHHTVISRFISGQRNISLTTASKLVKALGLELRPKKKGR